MSIIEIAKQYLVGKKVKHRNQYGREVSLKVEDVKMDSQHHQVTPDTQANDWYGESYTTYSLNLCFDDGSRRQVGLTEKINIVD
jgi:hypothetical protein